MTILFEDLDALGEIPKAMCADAKSALKTAYLTEKIAKEKKNGMSIEEVIVSYLPMTDPAQIHLDVEQILSGVDAVYSGMNDYVDEKWLEQHMNDAMAKLDQEKRFSYVSNLLELIPAESFDQDLRVRIDELKQSENISDDDVSFLSGVAMDYFSQFAGILTRSSVSVMESVMHELPSEFVKKFGEAGRDRAISYAAACYIMNHCGENPWSSETDIAEQQPYQIGVIAATNTESSNLMHMYYSGKIKLAVFKEKLKTLFRNAVAIGLQILIGAGMFVELVLFLTYTLHFGIWIAMIGAAAFSAYLVTKVITTQDMVDLVNGICNLVRSAWDACRRALAALFHSDIEAESSQELSEDDVVEADTEASLVDNTEIEDDEDTEKDETEDAEA